MVRYIKYVKGIFRFLKIRDVSLVPNLYSYLCRREMYKLGSQMPVVFKCIKRNIEMKVPVFDQNNNPLYPCKPRRARALLARKEAIIRWQKGIFGIKLVRKETETRNKYPRLALGIDTGSKREGYTVASEDGVVLNITSNTPYWVKDHVETRRILRRSRRYRKLHIENADLIEALLKELEEFLHLPWLDGMRN